MKKNGYKTTMAKKREHKTKQELCGSKNKNQIIFADMTRLEILRFKKIIIIA